MAQEFSFDFSNIATNTDLQAEELELDTKSYFYSLLGESKILNQHLKENVKGQDEAISRFVQGCFHGDILPDEESKSVTTKFIFGGPVGVGKSTLAEAAAEAMDIPLLKVELSDNAVDSNARELAKSIIEEGGDGPLSMVEYFVSNFPKCIIMFNELEKAHPMVLSALSKLFQQGSIMNKQEGKETSFKHVIFIFTTNLGASLYRGGRERNITGLPGAVVIDAIKSELAEHPVGEIINNFIYDNFPPSNVIMFNSMSIYHLSRIVDEGFASFKNQLKATYGLEMKIDPLVKSLFLYSHSNNLDAHSAKPESHIFIKNELYEFGRHFKLDGAKFSKIEQFIFKVKVPHKGDALRPLFVNEEPFQILVIADPKKYSYLVDSSNIELNFASSYEKAVEILKKKDILYCIIDLYYGRPRRKSIFMSMDDLGSKGVQCFEQLRRQLTDVPIFLMDDGEIDSEDKATFLQRGARQFINLTESEEIANILIDKLARSLFMQNKVDKLASRGKILGYNSAQALSRDGKKVEITFYDFYPRNNQTRRDIHLEFVDDFQPKERFQDVTGAVSAKKELEYLADFLKNPRKFVLEEGEPPKGAMLFGWKEAGKAALAKALAGECNAAFLSTTANYILALEPGAAISHISQLFASAKKCAPAVIFMEDLERMIIEDNPMKDILSNVLLENIKAMNENLRNPVLFVGSVDWPYPSLNMIENKLNKDVLHVMEYKIFVNMPSREERKQFIQAELERLKLSEISDSAINNIAERTTSTSISNLKDFLAFAARRVRRVEKEKQSQVFVGALDEFQQGEARERDEEKLMHTAYHEAGHAYMNWYNGNEASFITIVSRGNFGGYYMPKIDEKQTGMLKQQLVERIRVCLAGRGSEIVFLGEKEGLGTGISSDLENATNVALAMICYYGMDEDSLLSINPDAVLQGPYGKEVLDKASKLLKQEMNNTVAILTEGKEAIQKLAEKVAENNYLTGEEIEEILNQYQDLRKKN